MLSHPDSHFTATLICCLARSFHSIYLHALCMYSLMRAFDDMELYFYSWLSSYTTECLDICQSCCADDIFFNQTNDRLRCRHPAAAAGMWLPAGLAAGWQQHALTLLVLLLLKLWQAISSSLGQNLMLLPTTCQWTRTTRSSTKLASVLLLISRSRCVLC